MTFKFYPPAQSLQPFIQGYLEANSGREHGVNTLFPNGFSGIFFNFGNSGKLILKKEYDTMDVSVFGQIDRHFTVTYLPGFYSLGVLFKPAALARFLRIDMSELTNQAFDGALFRSDLIALREKLEHALSSAEKIALLDTYFQATLKHSIPNDCITDYALQMIHSEEKLTMGNLANQLCVSQRYVETKFKQLVGLSPKTYSMILRFKRVEAQLKKMHSLDMLALDLSDDYHDQNHFIKDFKRFSGYTPSGYFREELKLGRSYLVSG